MRRRQHKVKINRMSFPLRPQLDERLQTVLEQIQADTHADLGSDHAHLPICLVQSGRAGRCIAVELNAAPLEHARRNVALAGLTAQIEVRQGDGFGPIGAGEVQSASITGMGARTIVGILQRGGEKVPSRLILQPNDSARPLRVWAQQNGFHIVYEALASGFWHYPVLELTRAQDKDPAYQHVPLAAALAYGPHLLRTAPAALTTQLQADVARLEPLAQQGRPAWQEYQTAREAWEYLQQQM